MTLRRVAALALVATVKTTTVSAAPQAGLPVPPRAAVRVVETKVRSTTVRDPYRWMEDTGSAELVAWTKAQDEYTRATLAARPFRAELIRRIGQLAAARDEIKNITRRGNLFFYLKRPAAADGFKLYARDARTQAERVLFDPSTSAAEPRSSIDYYEASPRARYVALGVSSNGSEDSHIRVVDVATGQLTADVIDRARHAMPQWRSDERSFFYMRHPKVAPGAPAVAKTQKARNYLHVLGVDPDRDPAVFGYEVAAGVPVGLSDSTWVRVFPGSPFALAIARRGATGQRAIYAAPLASVVGPETPWKKVAEVEDGIDDYVAHGQHAYLLTHRDAPRGKVVRVSLEAPDLARAETIIAPTSAVLAELAVARDALYLRTLDGGIGRLVRVPFDAAATPLSLPFAGSVSELSADEATAGVVFQLESWTRAPVTYAYGPAKRRFTEVALTPPEAASPVALASEEQMVASADGTLVPLSIVYARGLDRSRPHPLLLTAYGSYGVSFDPYFEARRLAWLERGGVYAVAHVRGGGEYGEEWHVAGMKQHKQRSIDDFVACARKLVQDKLTTEKLLGIEGRSAGGIVIGGAITQHPELFAAAIIRVGIVDPLRFEHTPLGAANAQEFGSAANPDELDGLLAMSAYDHVVPGTRYPAMLLTGAAHDARVPLWQPAKFAARLQAATTSGRPVLLRAEYEGGHLDGANSQVNDDLADGYTFLLWQVSDEASHASPAVR
ncbi:MAG: f1pep1 2 [Myxococcales bacterium]|nr:f1pep1 2 [Myxococcales bacterium]